MTLRSWLLRRGVVLIALAALAPHPGAAALGVGRPHLGSDPAFETHCIPGSALGRLGGQTGYPPCDPEVQAPHLPLQAPSPKIRCGKTLALREKCESWASAYDYENGTPGGGRDSGEQVAVSPDGQSVITSGISFDAESESLDVVVISWRASNGKRRWVTRFDGEARRDDIPYALALSPDGTQIFVAGTTDFHFQTKRADLLILSLDAATGEILWKSTFDGGVGEDFALDVAVNPAGTRVFVTGSSTRVASVFPDRDFLTIAYDARDGSTLWTAIRPGAGPETSDRAFSIEVSPAGDTVYVSGEAQASFPDSRYLTVAYVAEDEEHPENEGLELWEAIYDSNPAGASWDWGMLSGLSPDGSRLIVSGASECLSGCTMKWVTLAYDTKDGSELWRHTFAGFVDYSYDFPWALEVSPTGQSVVVTGAANRTHGALLLDYDIATVSLDVVTGEQQWVARYTLPGHLYNSGNGVAITPDGASVFVTGSSWISPFVATSGGGSAPATFGDAVTIRYDASTGDREWVARYPFGGGLAGGFAVAVSPTQPLVFSTGPIYGRSDDEENTSDLSIVAYKQ